MPDPSVNVRNRPQVRSDLVCGVAMLGFFAVFRVKAGETNLDWLYPIGLSYVLGALAIFLILRGLLGYGDLVAAVPPLLRRQGTDVAVFILLAVAYVVLLPDLSKLNLPKK